MLRLALALLALIVLARAQFNGTCLGVYYGCSKLNGVCGASVDFTEGDYSVGCAVGTSCSGGSCVAQGTIGTSCTTAVGCWDPNYSGIACVSGTCKYVNIYGPGESCSTDANYVNGGCVTGQNCTSGSCSSVAAGSSTTVFSDAYCAPGSYSNGTNCVTQHGAGANCTGPQSCAPGLVCSNFGSTTALPTCVAPFSRAAGSSCTASSVFDCAANLRCLNKVCTAIPKTGQNCIDADNDIDNSICTTNGDAGVSCGCQTSTESLKPTAGGNSIPFLFGNGKGKCVDAVEHLTSSEQNAFLDIQSCASNKGCNDLFKLAASGVVVSGPNQCIATCVNKAYSTVYDSSSEKFNTCDLSGSGASAVILPSVVAIIALILAALL